MLHDTVEIVNVPQRLSVLAVEDFVKNEVTKRNGDPDTIVPSATNNPWRVLINYFTVNGEPASIIMKYD